jgi:hypothetical protein
LDFSLDAGRVHARGLIDSVAPDVEDWFARTDDATDDRSASDTHAQPEVVEGVRVKVIQSLLHGPGEVHQGAQCFVWRTRILSIGIANLVLLRIQPGRRHVCRANRLDLIQTIEDFLNLMKITVAYNVAGLFVCVALEFLIFEKFNSASRVFIE